MQSVLRSVSIALLSASAALSQVSIPPHASVYQGYSRGYNFTAGVTFTITQLQLPPEAFVAGDTGSFLIRVNGVTALRTVGVAGGSITPNLVINLGDVVDIIGNWSPAVTGNFTAHNSYTSTSPNATTILGVPHNLTRTGWQWDIGDTAWASGTYLPPVAGSMGRIFMFVAAPTGYATATPYGAGCYDRHPSFYENFGSASSFDLANSSLTMLYTGSGYTVVPGISSFVPPSGTATTVANGDDIEQTVTLGSALNFPGGNTSALTICSNGFVSAATGNGTSFTPATAAFLAFTQACWSPGWHDFNPTIAGSGPIQFEEVGSVSYVTWNGVWDFAGTSAANASTMQIQFDRSNGNVHMIWQTMSTLGVGFLTGYKPAGTAVDPGNRDISATLPGTFVLGADVFPLTLAASARPVINTSINLVTTNVPANSSVGATILSFTQHNPGLDLTGLGMPGCRQFVGLDSVQLFFPAGGTGSTTFTIPNNPVYAGMHVYAQSAAFSAGQNALGVLSSNGIDLLTGTL